MRISRLRHRGTIEYLLTGSPQYSASGEPNTVWTTLRECWMSIEPLNGRELFAAQEHASNVTVRIRIRYRDDVNATMRVLHEGKYYEIEAVLDHELRHREMELLCSEGLVEHG